MIIGVLWAILGYVVAEATGRGKLTTTIITAVAGGLGLGAGSGIGAAGPVVVIATAEGVATVACLAVIVRALFHRNTGPRIYYLASTSQVMAPEEEQTGSPLTYYGRKARNQARPRGTR